MQWKPFALAAAIAGALIAGPMPIVHSAHAACDAGDKIDKSTVSDARKKIEAAGYRKVNDLKKGCDNYWHAKAEKNGAAVFVVLSPQGEVMQEAD
jgi:hypothetical protein